ncbi:MAG: Lrp/AsnC family transcriptional regulator [archaeon]|nr:MAG: Lrp/AsnC family transcriptional regulator [archaeon]
MEGPKTVQRFQKDSGDVEARIIEAIQKVGPKNVSLLSRLTGVHAETVRYKLNKRFKRLGFRVHAEADYRRLGLVPHWGELRPSPRLSVPPRSLFLALNQHAYLAYYGKLLPQGTFACLFLVPEERAREHREFLSYLRARGLLQSYALTEAIDLRHPTMNPRYFNFQANRWDIDWSQLSQSKRAVGERTKKTRPAHLDYNDLLLLKELQIDALQHIASIAKKVGVHQKTLEYHYRVHVQKAGMVSGYLIRWQRDIERSVSHSALLARVTFRELGRELGRARDAVGRIPFLWEENTMSDGSYVATLCIPVQEANSTFDYLNSQIPDLYGRVELSFVKKTEASAFTIPHHMFDGVWKYDLEKMKRPFMKF